MIEHIEIDGFKSLRNVSLDLGAFNLFIGANASGKSNFFDALRVLQGIGYGFTIDEIFNGKPKGAASETWEPIRGGSANAATVDLETGLCCSEMRFAARLGGGPIQGQALRYSISMRADSNEVVSEALYSGEFQVFDTARYDKTPLGGSLPGLTRCLRDPQYPLPDRALIESCSALLRDAQFLNPQPAILRSYSTAVAARRMGEHGENFASLVKWILSNEGAPEAYTSWLKGLTPDEFDGVTTLQGAMQDYVFALRRNTRDFPASVLSDGTLRFAALVAAFFQPELPDLLLMEEIENGIHPSRLQIMVELMKSQSGRPRPQTFATTHSPLVVAWLSEADYKTTFYCHKSEETGYTAITPLSAIPRFVELARKQPASELFAEGWLENAL